MERGCFKGSLWFGILVEESLLSPFSPVFVCKESLVLILSLSAFPVKRESEDFSRVTWQALGKCLILSLLHCVAFSGAGRELSSGVEVTRVRFIFPVQPHDLIFLAPYSFVWVHPNWYLDLSYMLENVPTCAYRPKAPLAAPCVFPVRGKSFSGKEFSAGWGWQVDTGS